MIVEEKKKVNANPVSLIHSFIHSYGMVEWIACNVQIIIIINNNNNNNIQVQEKKKKTIHFFPFLQRRYYYYDDDCRHKHRYKQIHKTNDLTM